MAFLHKAVQSTKGIVSSFNALILSPNISMAAVSQNNGGTLFHRQLFLIPVKELNVDE